MKGRWGSRLGSETIFFADDVNEMPVVHKERRTSTSSAAIGGLFDRRSSDSSLRPGHHAQVAPAPIEVMHPSPTPMHPSPNGASHENGQRPTPIVIQTQPEADTKDGVRVKRRMSLTQDGRDAVANTETEANHSAMAFGDGISCTTWALHPQSVVRYYWDCFILLLMVY